MSLLTKLGHVALGAMPEDVQNYASRRFEWYNPAYGTAAESGIEGILGISYLTFNPHDAAAGMVFVNSVYQILRVSYLNYNMETHHLGNGTLELLWQIGKLGIQTSRNLIHSGKDQKDTVYPGWEDY